MRYCRLLKLGGQKGGYLFPGALSDYEDMFYLMLEGIQASRPELISPTVDVREDFGLFRSVRRGGTSHALNMDIDEKFVRAMNRWRDEVNSEVLRADIVGAYSRLDTIRPTRLRYSYGF